MNIFQAFSMALKSIVNNKMRSFLTMLGIIIGVGSVITLVSVMQGMQTQVMDQFNQMGTNKVNVRFNNYRGGADLGTKLRDYSLSLSDEVLGITPSTSQNIKLRYRNKTWSTNVYFGNEDFDLCNNFELVSGRPLSYADVYNRVRVCVIGDTVVQQFFGLESPLGKTIKIKGYQFTVVGTYKAKSDGKQYTMDDMLLVPESVMRTITGSKKIDSFTLKAVSGEATKSVTDKLQTFLEPYFNNEWDYNVYSENQWIEQGNEMTAMLTLVVGGIAGISLLVGGIGIMNIMLVSVSERTREIGIRMAIGAPRRAIISQFLIEAATISACGGILGIGLGALGSTLLSAATLGEVYMPSTPIAVGAFLFSVLLGVFFGFYPANKASKMQPVDALRNQ